MPKVLNVDKLEKKFSTVTKSKDSIQSLSIWIIYHKHFHDEICRHWLTALEKSNSGHRLTLFYVANDVLQHCKKKNAVEYRVAFAEVLEDAVLLAKEDIIKDEILRMINIWNERNVYSSDYLLQLTEILSGNSSGTSKTDSEKNQEIQEVEIPSEEDEAKILAEFKTTNLIACLQELVDLKKQVSIKEKELEVYEDAIAVPMKALNKRVSSETKKRYEKIDKASKLMESYLSIIDKETAARKQAIKLLGHSKVFYSTQNDEVRRVVHAYRLFGKKLKLVQQKLNEKMDTFPEPVKLEKSPSPVPSESDLSLPSAPSAVSPVNVENVPTSSPEVITTCSPSTNHTTSVLDSPVKSQGSCSPFQDNANLECVQSGSSLDERFSAFNQECVHSGSNLDERLSAFNQECVHSGSNLDERLSAFNQECVHSGSNLDERLSAFNQECVHSGSSLDERLSALNQECVHSGSSLDERLSTLNQECVKSGSSLDERLSVFNQKAVGSQFSLENVPSDILLDQQSAEEIEDNIPDTKMDESNLAGPKVKPEQCDSNTDQAPEEAVLMECTNIHDEQKEISKGTKSESEQTAEVPLHHDDIKQEKTLLQVEDDNQAQEYILAENNDLSVLETHDPVVTEAKLNGDAKIKSEPSHEELHPMVSRASIVNSSDPLQNINKLCHPSSTRNDCTKTTFTCLENPECSISEAPKNSQNMLPLLKSMKHLQRLIPKESTSSNEEIAKSSDAVGGVMKTFPLSAIFKILSSGVKSSLQTGESAKEVTAPLHGNELSVVSKKTDIAQAQIEEDDLMPMDMDLDSDEEM